jgi:hypothetical protein
VLRTGTRVPRHRNVPGGGFRPQSCIDVSTAGSAPECRRSHRDRSPGNHFKARSPVLCTPAFERVVLPRWRSDRQRSRSSLRTTRWTPCAGASSDCAQKTEQFSVLKWCVFCPVFVMQLWKLTAPTASFALQLPEPLDVDHPLPSAMFAPTASPASGASSLSRQGPRLRMRHTTLTLSTLPDLENSLQARASRRAAV